MKFRAKTEEAPIQQAVQKQIRALLAVKLASFLCK